MEIKKINCVACGAPIGIPDHLDYVNCASCGSLLSIERGEGYIALKVAEKISRTIIDTSRDTQLEIRRLQLQYELSTAENNLNGIRAEIRSAARNNINDYRMSELYILEYQSLEKIRDIRVRMSQLEKLTPEQEIDMLREQLNFYKSMLQSLYHSGRRSNDIIQFINTQMGKCNRRISELNMGIITSKLNSFRPGGVSTKNQEELLNACRVYQEDLRRLQSMPPSPERDIMQRKLEESLHSCERGWDKLERIRIEEQLVARNISRDDPQLLLQSVRADIQTLMNMNENKIVDEYLQAWQTTEKRLVSELAREEKKRERELKRQARKANSKDGKAGWVGLSLVAIGAFFTALFEGGSKTSNIPVLQNMDRNTPYPQEDNKIPYAEPADSPNQVKYSLLPILKWGLISLGIAILLVGILLILEIIIIPSDSVLASIGPILILPCIGFSLASVYFIRKIGSHAGYSLLGEKANQNSQQVSVKSFKWSLFITVLINGLLYSFIASMMISSSDLSLLVFLCGPVLIVILAGILAIKVKPPHRSKNEAGQDGLNQNTEDQME